VSRWDGDAHESLEEMLKAIKAGIAPPRPLGEVIVAMKGRHSRPAAADPETVAEVERTLTPRSEHSSEADLERALEREALLTDPEFGAL